MLARLNELKQRFGDRIVPIDGAIAEDARWALEPTSRYIRRPAEFAAHACYPAEPRGATHTLSNASSVCSASMS